MGNPVEDRALCTGIRMAEPQNPLRYDLNGSWSRDTALTDLSHMENLGPCVVEQPLDATDLEGLAQLVAESPVPIAADESVVLDPAGTLDIPGLAQVVLKPMFVGGLVAARDIANRAHSQAMSVCITHAMESDVGRLGALHLASVQPIQGVHGLELRAQTPPQYCVETLPKLGAAA